jgi:glucosamine--fructose-6-phosphate aminotransferase (isomerizing)
VLTLMACSSARRRLMSGDQVRGSSRRARAGPRAHRAGARPHDDAIRKVTEKYIERENWLFLGRGYNYPTAIEGALKLKEISYIHAEGMPAAEMKHGPIALIDDGMPASSSPRRGASTTRS